MDIQQALNNATEKYFDSLDSEYQQCFVGEEERSVALALCFGTYGETQSISFLNCSSAQLVWNFYFKSGSPLIINIREDLDEIEAQALTISGDSDKLNTITLSRWKPIEELVKEKYEFGFR